MKFAFVSQGLPPSWSGQSVVIYRLLKDLNPADYCLITQDYGQAREHRERTAGRLAGHYYYIDRRHVIPKGWRFGIVRWANIKLRARQIARIVRAEKCDAIVACPGDFFDLPAAFYASRMTGTRFYPYFIDYYSQQSVGFSSEKSAKRLEALIMKGATSVIVPNEFMGDELRRRYGVQSIAIVRNPCDVTAYRLPAAIHPNGARGEFRIVYTGSIYNAHFGAFQNLLSAIDEIGRPDLRLHIYSNQAREELEKNGVSGAIALHAALEPSAVPGVQQEADLLFLPLAFDSPFPELVRTSAPGKTGEYLAAGKPILVHAPADSFLSWYFRTHNCGLVVDEDSPEKIVDVLECLLVDDELKRTLGQNAWERAQIDFSIKSSRAAFANLLQLDVDENLLRTL